MGTDPQISVGQPVSVRLEPTLHEQVGALAAALDRPTSRVIEQAVKAYIEVQTRQLAAIDEGVRAAEEGRVASHEDVAAWVRAWDSPAERPPPKCG